jgi:fucose 4-O-acetylase-like acetyltransferase
VIGIKKYYEEIEMLKGISIILVILGHAIIVYPIDLHNILWCKILYDFIYTFHMPLFFAVSGYCFSYNKNYVQFIKKKVVRLLFPYIIFSLPDLLLRAFSHNLVNRTTSIQDGIKSILLYGGQYWFLYVLFLIFLIYPSFERLLRSKTSYLFVFLLIFVLNFIPLPTIFSIGTVVYWLPYFMAGHFMKKGYNFKFSSTDDRLLNIKFFPGALILFFSLFILKESLGLNALFLKYSIALLGIICMLNIIIHCKLGNLIKRFLIETGKYSLQLYLLNGYLLVISRVLLINKLHISNPFIIIVVLTVLNIAIAMLICKYFVDKYNLIRVIFGMPINKGIILH